jgi:hypothetical protein
MKVDSSLGLLGVLLEPTTVVTKAWEQIVAVGQRAFWEPRTVLVTDCRGEISWSESSGVLTPVPCPNCAVGEWDMCRNGQYN